MPPPRPHPRHPPVAQGGPVHPLEGPLGAAVVEPDPRVVVGGEPGQEALGGWEGHRWHPHHHPGHPRDHPHRPPRWDLTDSQSTHRPPPRTHGPPPGTDRPLPSAHGPPRHPWVPTCSWWSHDTHHHSPAPVGALSPPLRAPLGAPLPLSSIHRSPSPPSTHGCPPALPPQHPGPLHSTHGCSSVSPSIHRCPPPSHPQHPWVVPTSSWWSHCLPSAPIGAPSQPSWVPPQHPWVPTHTHPAPMGARTCSWWSPITASSAPPSRQRCCACAQPSGPLPKR